MPTLTTRLGTYGKGSALSHAEMDANWKRPVTAVTSTPVTLTEAHNRNIIECGTGSGTLVLTAAATLAAIDTEDWFVDIKNTLTTSITVDANGSETIDGALTLVIPAGQSARIALDDAQTGFVTVGQKPLCSLRAVRSTAQSHNSGSNTYDVVIFDSATYDHASALNTSTGLVTVPTGYNFFRVSASIEFDANGTGNRLVGVSTTTSASNIFDSGGLVPALSSSNTTCKVSTGWVPISVASSFYVLSYQNSGGNLDMTASSRLYVEFA